MVVMVGEVGVVGVLVGNGEGISVLVLVDVVG